MTQARPLDGVRVLDFSTLLPGPLCTLLLAEAGADVVKLERPGSGEEMRGYRPRFGTTSVNFALLNRGKRCFALDLKTAGGLAVALELAREADVVVEQFRPGVMDRLGLGYDVLARENPRLVYCSISGYGASGPLAGVAAHDLNYLAETGMLSLSAQADGTPPVPQALVADIAGGAYPAFMNILLALRQRERTGRGEHLDVAMADNLFTLMYWALGNGWAAGAWPHPGGELVTGGSPRYRVYRTADGRHLAVAALEDRFWTTFVQAIGAPHLAATDVEDGRVGDEIGRILAGRTAGEWERVLDGLDVCVNLVRNLGEALDRPQQRARRLFDTRTCTSDGRSVPALPTPIHPGYRPDGSTEAPGLRPGHEAAFAPRG